MSPKLRETIAAIEDTANPDLEQRIRRRLDSLTKPVGSLGRLEDLAIWYALCRGEEMPAPPRKALAVFCGDHDVTAEGVSAYPSEVTAQMAVNFAMGGAAISVLCRTLGIQPEVVDVGVKADLPADSGILQRKVAPGARNFARERAMTNEERDRALEVGMEVANSFADGGARLAAAGDMGIGNTTSAAALGAALTGAAPDALAGPGTGLDEAGRKRKAAAIEMALSLHGLNRGDPLRALSCVGGFEIAAIAGFYLGAAARRMAVVVDGFIATSAALVAVGVEPKARGYLAFGHASAEPGHRRMLDALGAEPLLDLGMRLGEGTGAALAMTLVDSSVALYRDMATFGSAGVSERR